MFQVFGAPKDTMERIEKQSGLLEKEKERFIKQMENNKNEIKNQIDKEAQKTRETIALERELEREK